MAINLSRRLLSTGIPKFGLRTSNFLLFPQFCNSSSSISTMMIFNNNNKSQPSIVKHSILNNGRMFSSESSQKKNSEDNSETFNQNPNPEQDSNNFGNDNQNSSTHTYTYMHDHAVHRDRLYPTPQRWPQYNNIVHPPEDGPVERYYCHYRDNIKYSPKKMFYIAGFIRGMSIDEAIKQLSYIPKKGAAIVREILEEARDISVVEHNFEYRSRMWIAESFVTKGAVFKGMRKHARMRFGEVRYFHCHYFVKLVEGEPPAMEQFQPDKGLATNGANAEKRFKEYVEQLRERRIEFAL